MVFLVVLLMNCAIRAFLALRALNKIYVLKRVQRRGLGDCQSVVRESSIARLCSNAETQMLYWEQSEETRLCLLPFPQVLK